MEQPITGLPDSASLEADPYYFYHDLDYGSEVLIHPFRLILNGGFGILQAENRSNRPTDVDYQRGMEVVWKNLKDPFAAIQVEGWADFLQREVIPVSSNSGNAQYWPNYMNHLLGGGMSYRLMVEWFRYRGFVHPTLWGVSTMVGYHFVNEVVENQNRAGWTTDPVADLLLFDPASMLLFSIDGVSRFFGETLNMREWSYQPALDPSTGELHNFGQNFAIKWRLPRTRRWSLFYHWGGHAEIGLSFTRSNGESISMGAGFVAKNIVDIDQLTTATLATSAGIFYDRNNSLLVSLLFAQTKDYSVRLNIYPGLIDLGPMHPSFFVAVGRTGEVSVGITIAEMKVIPFGYASSFGE